MSLTMMLILLHICDGAIPFESRQDADLGIQFIKKVFSIFGLTIYTRIANKSS